MEVKNVILGSIFPSSQSVNVWEGCELNNNDSIACKCHGTGNNTNEGIRCDCQGTGDNENSSIGCSCG